MHSSINLWPCGLILIYSGRASQTEFTVCGHHPPTHHLQGILDFPKFQSSSCCPTIMVISKGGWFVVLEVAHIVWFPVPCCSVVSCPMSFVVFCFLYSNRSGTKTQSQPMQKWNDKLWIWFAWPNTRWWGWSRSSSSQWCCTYRDTDRVSRSKDN